MASFKDRFKRLTSYNIEDIDSSSITTDESLTVELKKSRVLFSIIAYILSFSFGIIVAVHLGGRNNTIIACLILIILIIKLSEYLPYYFDAHDYLLINIDGIIYKKKKILWTDIERINYRTFYQGGGTGIGDTLQSNSLSLLLKSNKKINIEIQYKLVDTPVNVIAAYIKKFWRSSPTE